MRTYRNFQPTGFDPKGLALDERQDWLVVPCTRNRDSDCRAESNFDAALKTLGGEGADVEIHRFGHWACGWFEILIVRPDTDAAKKAEEIESALSNYPILDEADLSERETEAANDVWRTCYTAAQRVEYIRKHRSQFSFGNMRELLHCVRGKYFAGYSSELLS